MEELSQDPRESLVLVGRLEPSGDTAAPPAPRPPGSTAHNVLRPTPCNYRTPGLLAGQAHCSCLRKTIVQYDPHGNDALPGVPEPEPGMPTKPTKPV